MMRLENVNVHKKTQLFINKLCLIIKPYIKLLHRHNIPERGKLIYNLIQSHIAIYNATLTLSEFDDLPPYLTTIKDEYTLKIVAFWSQDGRSSYDRVASMVSSKSVKYLDSIPADQQHTLVYID